MKLVLVGVIAVAFVAACGDNGEPTPAVVDASVDDAEPVSCEAGQTLFGSADGVFVCLALAPSGSLVLEAQEIDTDTDVRCVTPGKGQDGCALAAQTITVTGRVRAYGSRTLILIATDHLDVMQAAAIDVSSNETTWGASANQCRPWDPQMSAYQRAAEGGQLARATVDGVHGGCPGQPGYRYACTIDPEPPGGGGGAVLLIAPTVAIDGVVNASGAGGGAARGTSQSYFHGVCGAGGGGSGGMIVIDAHAIQGDGLLLATGGGGGGAINNADDPTGRGHEPDESMPLVAAVGGAGFMDPYMRVAAGGPGGMISNSVGGAGSGSGPQNYWGANGGGAGTITLSAAFSGVVAPSRE
ncbi:MAG TPA: hypothetical protein VGM90_33145 [Kofleriaceae bacterium]|jgi:hypothetical protein